MRKGITMGIETIGKIVLILIVAIAVIIFVVTGIGAQSGGFEQAGSSIVGNLSDKAQSVKTVIN